jgi:methionyl-tRNA synthetase
MILRYSRDMNTEKKPFYITTTLPYVNADPHVGFGMELVRADVLARYKTLTGHEVFFNTGTDEHGQKLLDDAKKAGENVKDYVDRFAKEFKGLSSLLHISPDVHYIRTTDAHHESAAQEFWKRVDQNGYIYKKQYQVKYCVGCELEKTDSELVDGKCPIHPTYELQLIDEENYFFKFSAFQQPLLDFYTQNPNFIVPDFRFNEIKAFIERGLEDFSISRLKSKMSWGIPVPGDDQQVMYVWFDALANYVSTLGWPDVVSPSPGAGEGRGEVEHNTVPHPNPPLHRGGNNTDDFTKFWVHGTPTQYCGKDNLRQQSAMWQAMLMAAKLPNSHQIIINGFFTGEGGIKMSKSIGNVVNPYSIVNEYGTDAFRLFVCKEVSMFEDSPFTIERFAAAYNANLVNGLGNLVSRTLTMAQSYDVDITDLVFPNFADIAHPAYEKFDYAEVTNSIWSEIADLDKYITDTEPFKTFKVDPDKARADVHHVITGLARVAVLLQPIMPTSAAKIMELIKKREKPELPLFGRK